VDFSKVPRDVIAIADEVDSQLKQQDPDKVVFHDILLRAPFGGTQLNFPLNLVCAIT
jgi:hypothetical protein